MIGQQKLIAQIDDLIANDRLPRFSIVVGERGMEHEDVAHYISEQYQGADYIQLPDVKVDTIRNMIKQAYQLHHLTVFCIPHADDMSVNAKNAMLKVVEEAPNKAYFVMCLEDLSNTLATIQSRGIVLRMYKPTKSEIEEYARELYVDKKQIDEQRIKLVGEICDTPNDVIYFTKHDITNFYAYAEYVTDNIFNVNGAEVFKFSDKLALKDEEDKYDCRLFLKCLQKVFADRCKSLINDSCGRYCNCKLVSVIGHYLQDLRIKGVNRAMLMDALYLEMRKIWKSQM